MWHAHQRALTRPAANVAIANGKLLNFNTIEEFKASDKKALFAEVADEVLQYPSDFLPSLTFVYTDLEFIWYRGSRLYAFPPCYLCRSQEV